MKSKTTGIWFVIAASLFAAAWLSQRYFHPRAAADTALLAGWRAADIDCLHVSPAGQREIVVVRTNGQWVLQNPLSYPAQAAAVQALVAQLVKLTPALRLTAADLHSHKNADADYGFENPQFNILVQAGNERRQLIVGNRTAPGDQVFVRVAGVDGVFVTDAAWLQQLPLNANVWRDTSLVDATGNYDLLVITNASKSLVMEFRRDGSNQSWRMINPLQTRADNLRINAALQQLRNGRVDQFVTDDPRADLSTYGLAPADLDIWLGQGTNLTSGVSMGKSLPDAPAKVYARRQGWNAVVATAKDAFAPWRSGVNDFRDPFLISLDAPVAEIEVKSSDSYTLQAGVSNAWSVVGEKYPADLENVQNFLKLLASLRISEFVKDVVTPATLQDYGLATPSRQITLLGRAGDTNSVLVQLLFGNTDTNRVFVKRGDEPFVYALKLEDFARLPEHGWEFRARHIWNFSPTNVAQVTLRQSGKTRVLLRTGEGQWSLGSGSQGIISPKEVEETVQRLGDMTVAGWVARDISTPEKYGLNPDNLSLTVELKTGEKLSLDFGTELQRSQTALAAVSLDGGRWVFVMDPTLYQFVATFLTIPPNAP